MPSEANSAALPTATRLPSTVPITPLPVSERKSAAAASVSPRSSAPLTMAAASGCSLPRSRLATRRSSSSSSMPADALTPTRRRLAFGQGAGLVDDQRVDLLHQLERLGILDEHAGARAAAGADHDRHRRRQPERAGAGDDQHGDGIDQREAHRRRRAEERPDDKGRRRRRSRRPARTRPRSTSTSRWIGARVRCASATICDDLRQQRSLPTRSARMTKLPVPLTVAPVTLSAGALLDRHRLAGDHRFIDRAVALEHHAVDRDFLAGPHAQAIAGT